MATITLTVADERVVGILEALDTLYGGEVQGLTSKQKVIYHLKATL